MNDRKGMGDKSGANDEFQLQICVEIFLERSILKAYNPKVRF